VHPPCISLKTGSSASSRSPNYTSLFPEANASTPSSPHADAKSVLAKFAKVVTQRKIPWALVFGDRDDEDGDSKRDQVRYMQGLSYSLVQAGPTDIRCVGNYILKVGGAGA